MGDANEVKDLTLVVKDLLLREAGKLVTEKPKLYNLEEEFARTRANRSLRVFFLVLGFVAAAVAATFGITMYIEDQNRRISVDIKEFDDVNLKDLLNVAKKNDNDMALARTALADLNLELSDRTGTVNVETASAVEVLNTKGLSAAELTRQTADARAQGAARIAALRTSYAPRIAAKQAEIKEIQKKIDEYDQRSLESARKQEEVINNQQKLHDLEMGRQKGQYEAKLADMRSSYDRDTAAQQAAQKRVVQALNDKYAADMAALKAQQKKEIAALILKYNPVFESDADKALLAAGGEPAARSGIASLRTRLAEKSEYADAAVTANHQAAIAGRDAMLARLKKIPWENSVPPALARLDVLDQAVMTGYEAVADRLLKVIQARDAAILTAIQARDEIVRQKDAALQARDAESGNLARIVQQDRVAFEFYARKIRENGFILDPGDPARVSVYLNPVYSVQDGDQGLVFRLDDQYIATVRFSVAKGGAVTASVLENAPDQAIEPFDRFLIKRK